ncbi:hypothetical protein Hanom_Chr16g01433781 [Helianthus anomalus]
MKSKFFFVFFFLFDFFPLWIKQIYGFALRLILRFCHVNYDFALNLNIRFFSSFFIAFPVKLRLCPRCNSHEQCFFFFCFLLLDFFASLYQTNLRFCHQFKIRIKLCFCPRWKKYNFALGSILRFASFKFTVSPLVLFSSSHVNYDFALNLNIHFSSSFFTAFPSQIAILPPV